MHEDGQRVAAVSLLFVDDEDSFRKLTARELSRTGYEVDAVGTLEEARQLLAHKYFHLVLLDVRLPDGNGLDLLQEIREASPSTEVVMLTAYGTVQEAIRAMKQGAHDFLTKPCKLVELEERLEKAMQKQYLQHGNTALRATSKRRGRALRGVLADPRAARCCRAWPRPTPPLIRGERRRREPSRAASRLSKRNSRSGGGLRLAAREPAAERAVRPREGRLHRRDPPQARPVRAPTAARSSWTRSARSRRRWVKRCALETGTFRRVGGTTDIKVNVRVIAATNRVSRP